MRQNTKSVFDEILPLDLFRKINDICAAVTVSLNSKELLEISLKKTMDLFDARRGSIFILDESKNRLILKISQGLKIDEQEKMIKRLGEGVVGKVAALKKPLFVEDISRDRRFQNHKSRKSYKTPSFLCAPLMVKDTLIGVINIADKESGSYFTETELQLLDFLSSQVALNYRRTQLYLKFKTIIKESKTLKDQLGKSSEVADQLKRQMALQERLASIGKLTGGIAHELNNPLDGILRYINLSLTHLKDGDIVRGYLLEAKHGLHRMANIVRSMLACSRNSSPTMKKINVTMAVKDVIAGVKREIVHKNIAIEEECTNDLPEILDLGVERIVSNLLRNAVDAVEENGRIKVRTALEGDFLAFMISDSGCGIPKDAFDRIFEPFYTTKDIEKGCGLGLTIVSEIVKSYKGTIEIDSALNKGTTFTIKLPLYTCEHEGK